MKVTCESCQAKFRLDDNLVKATGSTVWCSKCGEIFTVYPPQNANRRKHQRVDTRNLISHASFDKAGKLISQGLSKALDISKGGMLLETPHPIESGLISLMATDRDGNLIEIKGRLRYCKKSSDRKYLSGISFIGTDVQVAEFVTKLIKEYNHRRKNLLISVAQ